MSDTSAQTSLGKQLRSFGPIYWTANWIELVERFAYYGLRTVVGVYMVIALSDGGPELTHEQKGDLFAFWALVQSFVPIFTGGLADRYGYKLTIALSTAIKIAGYLLMCYALPIAGFFHADLSAARASDEDLIYEFFFVGAMLLALGTAVFKPGVQGLIANQMPKGASSLGWGLFYQMVNIGGFIGPLIAGCLRVLQWEHVFWVCAGGVALNFIPLFFFREPARPVSDQSPIGAIMVDTLRGLLIPRVFFFTVAFAAFWLMFHQLFDILPNFISDWVDSRSVRDALVSLTWEGAVPSVDGGNMTQEWLININALMISIFAFAVGYLTGKVRSLHAILAGIVVSAIGIYSLGLSTNGWVILGSIMLFSLGEMMASPTKLRYFASITPPGKEGQYLGYVNFTNGIGWSIGSIVAGKWYDSWGDKINLARRYLAEQGKMSEAEANALDRGKVMEIFEEAFGVDAWQARELLWDAYDPSGMWGIFALIGISSLVLLLAYDWVTQRSKERPDHPFNKHGIWWVRLTLLPIMGAFAYACIFHYTHAVLVITAMFVLLFVASFIIPPEPEVLAEDEEGERAA